MSNSSDRPTLIADPLIGRQIRDLRIVEPIGQGGMGAVYKAEHVLLHEPRALKVMRTELFRSIPNAVERFEREARIAVKLRHPNLVLLYDFFVHEELHYLVMEYVTGTSLAAFLREQGPLSAEATCQIGIQCCAGLAHAHEMGIVHRDLSPENIMLSSAPAGLAVKIIDFGVARAAFGASGQGLEADHTLTQIGEFVGKPRYASPEQAGALRRGEMLDHRSDLYTLGLILYEMATGQVPFTGETAFDYLVHHVHTPPVRPSQAVPDFAIPPALEEVILRCLAKKRDDRYASASELAAALEGAWRGTDTTTMRPAPPPAEQVYTGLESARRGAPRRRLAPLAAVGAVAATAVASAGLWWARTGEEAKSAATTPAAAAPTAIAATPVALAEPDPIAATAEPQFPAAAPPQLEPAPPAQTEPELQPAPAPQPTPRSLRPPQPEPQVRRETAPAPKSEPARPAPSPRVVAFADASEMQSAFDAALEYERTHSPQLAIAGWKQFRSRAPTRELDEQAKHRITALTLGNLPGL